MKYRASSLGIDSTTHKNELGFRVVAASVMLLYLALLYGIYVPDWDFVPTSTFSNSTLLHVSAIDSDGVCWNCQPKFQST